MRMRYRILAFTLATIVAAAATIAPANAQTRRAEGSFDRTLNVTGTVDLDVSTGAGRINIRQGAAGRVEIHGRIQAGSDWFGFSRDATDTVREIEANPPIEQNGSAIRI